MPDIITIRAVDERDAAALIEYLAALRAERLPTIFRRDAVPTLDEEIEFIRRSTCQGAACFIATMDGKVVANLGVCTHQHPQMAHRASLGMAVLGPYRGQGIGSRLLDVAIDWGERQGLLRLELEVFSNNSGAVRLYDRKGFVVEGCRHGAVSVDGEFVDLLLMARRLGAGT
jgi:RimJ/RimL family protein N-acetyltransferase